MKASRGARDEKWKRLEDGYYTNRRRTQACTTLPYKVRYTLPAKDKRGAPAESFIIEELIKVESAAHWSSGITIFCRNHHS